jgi:D,D-heptose 1,7-bisphosphate phosphatase
MVPVCGKPLLERIVALGVGMGLNEFVFLNGHLAEVIEAHFGDGTAFGARIEHVREPEPLGTAGAVLAARDLLLEPFIVLYGDILIDVDLNHLARFAADKGGLGAVLVHPNDHPYDSDLVEADDTGRITRFHPKPHTAGALLPNLVSGAVYVLNPAILSFVPASGASDWARDIFPAAVAAGGQLFGYRSIEYSKDIGTPERLAKGEGDLISGRVARLSRRTPKPAIFFDRDGVLNVEKNGVHRPDMMELIEGAGPALKKINRAGVASICVTNQPDLAKGMMTREDLRQVFAALDTELGLHGAYLDDVFFCPHHPERGWPEEVAELKIDCDCRKPRPGMLLRAAEQHNLDLSKSWLIGDAYSDIAAARAAGVRAILVKTGRAGHDKSKFDLTPDHIAENVAAAVDHILEQLI